MPAAHCLRRIACGASPAARESLRWRTADAAAPSTLPPSNFNTCPLPALYLHVPFCRQACSYCNFHFSTSGRGHQEMVDAMCRELEMRDAEMPAGPWTSIYFGGGTPSLLSPKQVAQLLDAAARLRPVIEGVEITLEANPDDLSEETLAAFAKTAINRLSIGVQSFRESDLRYMNRAHNAQEALASIARAQAADFDAMTIDLIYGTPGLDDDAWRHNLQQTIDLGIPHISAYALTVEPKTALADDIKKGRSLPVDEEQSARQMEILVATLTAAGYEHYEISNFALPGQRARHNSNYWLGEPYLGVGPSAHSFDGSRTRSWNVANNALYVKAIEGGALPIEREILTDRDRYNELILTRLRTVWGVTLAEVEALGFRQNFEREVRPFLREGLVVQDGDVFRLSAAGRMLADGVSAELFAVEA